MNKSKGLAAPAASKTETAQSAATVCDSCKRFMTDLIDRRMRRILELGRGEEELEAAAESHCFHLMEIQRILNGEKTCGVYDDFGKP